MLAGLVVACTAQASAPPCSTGSPNAPPGLAVLSDWGMDAPLPTEGDVPIGSGSGWAVVNNAPPGTARGSASLAYDSTAPFKPASVYDFEYPQGMVEGTAPATVYFPYRRSGWKRTAGELTGQRDGLASREVYVSFWWKPSTRFDFGPNGNKIAFLFNGGGDTGGQQFLILMPDGRLHVLPEYPNDFRWRHPNVTPTVVKLGVWHRIEWHSNVVNGDMEWWLDGTLQGRYNDVRNAHEFDMFQFSPTWGGNTGAKKRETDHYWFGRVKVCVRG